MDIFGLLTGIGGLALFLYGMRLMGEGLAQMSGGRAERALRRLTDSPGKAVLMGTGITALIQSSSAVTVMVVGLADAGLLKLQQAAGVIMGANIGTTVTSWLLGLAGIDASSTFSRLLHPTSLAPMAATAGVALLFCSKKRALREAASVLVGFSLLLFGMDTMSEAMRPFSDMPQFAGLLTQFSHPIPAMAAGMALTALIQSSSASVGMLQALCSAGMVNYGTALPIILGQNIGTCVTALLSAAGGGRNAKCAALVHLYFNGIGTAIFMSVFYAVNAIRPFSFLNETADALGIALLHSVFNIVSTMLLLPFSDGLVKLAYLTVLHKERVKTGLTLPL